MCLFGKKRGELVVISGFSGVGKGTIIKKLMEKYPDYTFSVSATTRDPRPGEVNGREYFFISHEEFDRWVEEGRFLEHAKYVNNSYGTPAEYVEQQRKKGRHVILDIEMVGALNVRKNCPDAKLIYIIPPTAEDLERRILGRGTETAEQVNGRLAKAVEEAPGVCRYDYIIVNDVVEDAMEELNALVTGRGKPRTAREDALRITEAVREDLANLLKEKQNCDKIN